MNLGLLKLRFLMELNLVPAFCDSQLDVIIEYYLGLHVCTAQSS